MNEEETGRSFLLLAIFNIGLLAAVFAIGLKQHRSANSSWNPCGGSSRGCVEGSSRDDAVGPIVSIEDMLVQLQPLEEDRFVRLSLGLEVDGERSETVVMHRTVEIREAILRTFAEHKPSDLQGSEGLAALKRSLMSQLHEIVPGKRIRNIYVTDFNVM
jgi:flagellar basal body-associated protein FliL